MVSNSCSRFHFYFEILTFNSYELFLGKHYSINVKSINSNVPKLEESNVYTSVKILNYEQMKAFTKEKYKIQKI